MNTTFLLIGTGIAGMSTALRLAKLGEVVIVAKSQILSGSTILAQGGIAGSTNDEYSQKNHIADTIRAGAGENNADAVGLLVSRSFEALNFLKKQGVVFDINMHTEAGHSEARIWHTADQTGLTIANALAKNIRESERITLIENAFVPDLLARDGEVFGAEIFHEGVSKRIFALKTVLATGGAGQIFSETTNPVEATGDGIAMGSRAGAILKDMEFVQFHPTALATEQSPLFLLSEALRGEGAKIVNEFGDELCDALLSRDQLSRIIFQHEVNQAVYLDLRHKSDTFWKERFPNIFNKLQQYDLSPEKNIIPILPAAHFFCGGIETDLRGRTNIKNLSAVGEVACTGVHGANRLASNSLLEALVFSEQIFLDFSEQIEKGERVNPYDGHFETLSFSEEMPEDREIRKIVQNICWNKVGIIRTKKDMDDALYRLSRLSPTGTETKNMHAVAIFVVEAARKREQSLGCHYVQK